MRRALAIFALLGACGDNLEGIGLENLQTSRRAAECERYTRCGLFGTEESCNAYFRDTYDPALPLSVAAGKVRYDPLAAAACNSKLASLGCDGTAADVRTPPAVCDRVLIGTIPATETCVVDRECATGRCDAPDCPPDQCCPGGCEAFAAPGKLDDTCTVEVGCVEGTYCADDMHCHAQGKIADLCTTDLECAVGLGCIGPTELQKGNCRRMPKLGEPCPYERCAEIGARCVAQVCVPIGLAAQVCVTDGDCSPFLTCDPQTFRCAYLPDFGETCNGRCAGGAWCDVVNTHMCLSPQPNAAPCTSNDQCSTEFCEEGPIFDQCAQPEICF